MPSIRYNDYSRKMPHLDFKYDEEYYPEDSSLPDPQVDPVLLGAKVPIQKVGVTGVDLPIDFLRRSGESERLHVKASLYASLDNPEFKGLNLSRFPILMHDKINPQMLIKDPSLRGHKFSIDVIKDILTEIADKQKSSHAYCKFRFAYPMTQQALRTRKELPNDAPSSEVFKEVDGKKLSFEKAEGYIFYNCELEGQYHQGKFDFYLMVEYVFSSSCPCSFELAQHAREHRGKAANGHSQKSVAKIKVQFDLEKIVWIEDLVELAREAVPTEVVVICKRRDEQAFAELNGSGLIFVEDSVRLFYQYLDKWYVQGKIKDFSVAAEHRESLHIHEASAVIYKGVPGGLR